MKSVWAFATRKRMMLPCARKTGCGDAGSMHHKNLGHIVVVEEARAM